MIKTAFDEFWRQYPALLYGLAVLLGISLAFSGNSWLLIPIGFLVCPALASRTLRIRLLLALGLLVGSFVYAKMSYQLPSLPKEGVEGTADLEISSVSSLSTHFGKRWVYRGVIRKFESESSSGCNIPYTLSLPHNDKIIRPQADCNYRVEGKLKQVSPGRYAFSVGPNAAWYPLETWNLSEMRYQTKQVAAEYIKRQITNPRSAAFLTGLATGEFDDRLMQHEFSRFGLQHIMAISGFHFSIIASILSLLLRLVISKRKATCILIFLLSSYFLFLGSGPSIMRAWLTVMIALGGFLLEKRASGLNSLGVAMLVILLINPLFCLQIGFQFSFVATCAILLIYPLIEYAMREVLPKRRLSEMVQMDGFNQHAYCLLAFFRQALALTIAVNLVAMPLMLFYFGSFPLLSLLYNLFFPFLVSMSMFLLLLGLIGGLVFPPLGSMIHALNSSYTHFVLNFTYNLPISVDVKWRVSSFPFALLILYLCIVFVLGIYLYQLLSQKKEELHDFAFL